MLPLFVVILLLLTRLPLPSQQETTTISKDVNVVNVLASVRDKKGQIVSNLTMADFKLEEDGRPQNLRYFAKETDLPLTLGLLVDTSMSQRHVLEPERVASYAFLGHLMREGKDNAFLIHFDFEIELLQDLTSSRQKMEAALQKLDTPEYRQASSGGGSPGGGPGGSGHRGGGTTLYDAVFLASDEIMHKQQGRKALIILSDGVDTGSKVSLERAVESAQRADTLVYSILFKDDEAYGHNGGFGGPHSGGGMGRHGGMGGGPWGGGGMGHPGGGGGGYPQQGHADGKKVLQKISLETGGRFFEVTKKEPIGDIYDQIENELRNQYSLGYTPNRASSEPGYHTIRLTTTQKDMTVQTRQGYYSDK